MKLEILGEVPRVAGRCFRQKTLDTEITWDGVRPLPPTAFTVVRVSFRTHIWRGPDGEQWDYDQLREHCKKEGIGFPGTACFSEAIDIEYWEDAGDDGHIEWEYQATYRMFLQPETDGEGHEWHWLSEISGDKLMRLLGDHVYERNRDRRQAEFEEKK